MSAQNTQIQTGDIKDLQKNYKFGWFMGSFVDEETPFHSKDFELKLGTHPKGEVRESTSPAGNTQETLCIIIEGAFKIVFHDDNREVIVDKPYQYFYFSPSAPHTTTALEESKLLTIRWPSL
ncbi:hypothetical protein HN803_01190 [candidate division WWE3 bacterium]|jgi:hypothetical protein|nr:hypothetical protein [candidate division WWE3 bacterium]MBT7349387.1 hypothetical protein [candidate division WWE3 bacterium]